MARGGIVAEHLDAAGRRPDEAEHQLHQRRLAGAVVSDERHGLALLEIERGFAHGVNLAEALRDLPDPNRRRAHGRGPQPIFGRAGGAMSGWLSTTPPGSSAGNCACAQRITCTAGLFISTFACGAVQSTRSTRSFGR